jgi:hypothetical protein
MHQVRGRGEERGRELQSRTKTMAACIRFQVSRGQTGHRVSEATGMMSLTKGKMSTGLRSTGAATRVVLSDVLGGQRRR